MATRENLFRQTILSGDLGTTGVPGDNSYHVVIVVPGSVDPSTEVFIDGFSIQYGYADAGSAPDNQGGGIYCQNTDLVLRNCFVDQNYAAVAGGGLYFDGGLDASGFHDGLRASRNFFTNNAAGNTGGAMHLVDLGTPDQGNVTDEPSSIYNSAYYRNLAGSVGSGTRATDGGGAIYVGARTELGVLPDVGWGSAVVNITLAVYNTELFDNYVYGGGAAVRIDPATASGGRTLWFNCTMARNRVYDTPGPSSFAGTIWTDLEASGREPTAINTIVWDTLNAAGTALAGGHSIEGPGSAAGMSSMPATYFLVGDSDVQVYLVGGNNSIYANQTATVINADPLFVNGPAHNYALAASSPCANSGINSLILFDAPDLDGDSVYVEQAPYHIFGTTPRIYSGGTVDMGAFERQF